MSEQQRDLAPYVGEFRYVFYALRDMYAPTVAFYRDALEFPIVGGFAYGTYFQASTGTIEVIEDRADDLRDLLLESGQPYQAARGGFLLIEVDDLQALQHRVERAGTPLMQAPRDWDWGFRDFKVKDPCGNVLCFFSRLRGWEAHHKSPPTQR